MLPLLGYLSSVAFLTAQPLELASTDREFSSEPASFPQDASRVVGGRPVKSCQWPSAMIIDTGRFTCSGTLVHPQIFVTASHCLVGNSFTVYSGDGNKGENKKTLKERKVEYCRKHPDHKNNQTTPTIDFAYCKLQEPVTDIAPMPMLMGCEVDYLKENNDLDVTVVGFGYIDPQDKSKIGTKYEVDTKFLGIERGLAKVGLKGKGPLQGDSGGPVYIRLPEDKFNKDAGWRVFGVTSTSRGNGAPDGRALYGLIHTFAEFLEKDSGLDVTPCTDPDGTWNPNKDCKGAFSDPYEASGDWVNGCEPAPPGGYISSCGKPFAPGDDDGSQDESTTEPEVKILGIKPGQELPADTTELEVEVQVKADSKIKSVTLQVNGKDQKKLSKAPYTWTIENLKPKSYTLKAQATDEAGNTGHSKDIKFSILKPGQEPSDDPSTDPNDSENTNPGEDPQSPDEQTGSSQASQEPETSSPQASGEGGSGQGSGGGCNSQGQPTPAWALLILPMLALQRRRIRG